ncbi:MAG TPA: methenyltetrahydromethanopterin cyclohydrolase [Burkholderiaceae bacterium]
MELRHSPPAPARASVNGRSAPLVADLLERAEALRLAVTTLPGGATQVDAGIGAPGGLEAGRRIAEICLGGLGSVALTAGTGRWPLAVSVVASDPVLACLGSQYAGWSLSAGTGKQKFQALGSGPARALAVKEPLFAELGYRDRADSTCLVLEVDRPPPEEIVDKVARDCGVAPERLTVILTPTQSLAGMVQIVARVLEVALHKMHTLGFPLHALVDGAGHAPLPPPSPEFLTAMGRSNDAILFGGAVHLFVRCEDAAAAELAARLPCSASRDYGRPFSDVFRSYGFDFYKIDPMLFAPATALVTNLATGRNFRGGEMNEELLARSFES